MLTKRQVVSGILVCFTMGLSSLSFAENTSQSTTESTPRKEAAMSMMSPELRKDMADMYQKMADCMRTDQSLSLEECQRKVAKDCPVVAKTGQCPILEGMGPMQGSRGMRQEGMGPMQGSRGMRQEGMGPMRGPHKMR